MTLLIMSSHEGHQSVVKLLLAMGAKVDQASNTGNTPLSVSRLYGHREVAKLLLASVVKLEQAEKAAEVVVKEEEGEPAKKAPRVCQMCGKEAAKMKKCSVCKRVRYCSEECQLKDWKEHKKACKTKAAVVGKGGGEGTDSSAAAS